MFYITSNIVYDTLRLDGETCFIVERIFVRASATNVVSIWVKKVFFMISVSKPVYLNLF